MLSLSKDDVIRNGKIYGLHRYLLSKTRIFRFRLSEYFYSADKLFSTLHTENKDLKDVAYDHGKVQIDMARILQRVNSYIEAESVTIKAIENFQQSDNIKYLPLTYTNLRNDCQILWKNMTEQ